MDKVYQLLENGQPIGYASHNRSKIEEHRKKWTMEKVLRGFSLMEEMEGYSCLRKPKNKIKETDSQEYYVFDYRVHCLMIED